MRIRVSPDVLGVAAMLMLIFQPSLLAQTIAGSQRFDVARLLPKGKSELGILAVNGPTIQFFKRDSLVHSEQSFDHISDPKSLWSITIEVQDISEIMERASRTFDLGLRSGDFYRFCALNEKLKCGAPVEKVIEALTAAVAAAPVAKESDAEPGDAQKLPIYEGYNAPAHHFAPIPLPDPSSKSDSLVGSPASTFNHVHLGLPSSNDPQLGSPQYDKAFSGVLTAILSSAGDGFTEARLRQRDFPQDKSLTLWETSLRFPGTNSTCLVWARPGRVYMGCPIKDALEPTADSRALFEEALRTLIRVLPDDWTIAEDGIFGLDQLSRLAVPNATLITVSFELPTHPEQSLRVTFTPSLGFIDLYISGGMHCGGCSTKSVAELRTMPGRGVPSK